VNTPRLRWSSAAAFAGLLMIVPTGCAVRGGGVEYGGGYGYGADYYGDFGADYGGWGDGYYVGPYRNGGYRGGDHDHGGHDHGGGHAYRPASGGRGTPSIPSGSRGGGGHGGGGHH
jgi:hypothetical protein